MPKGNEAQKAERAAAIQAATLGAMETPLEVAELSLASMEVMVDMAERGNPELGDGCRRRRVVRPNRGSRGRDERPGQCR